MEKGDSFENAFKKFIKNVETLVHKVPAHDDLKKMFSDAADMIYKSKVKNWLEDPTLCSFLMREMNFYDEILTDHGIEKFGPKKLMDASSIMFKNIGKHVDHWIVIILQETAELISTLYLDANTVIKPKAAAGKAAKKHETCDS